MLLMPLSVLAAGQFECSINSVLKLGDNGKIVTHGWTPNYLNRQFTVERESGKVISTTALKARLTNFNGSTMPVLLDIGDLEDSFKAVTLFEENGRYAVLEINQVGKGSKMPFIYHTSIGMILAGSCDAS